MIVGVAWIVIMTAICYLGIELSAVRRNFCSSPRSSYS